MLVMFESFFEFFYCVFFKGGKILYFFVQIFEYVYFYNFLVVQDWKYGSSILEDCGVLIDQDYKDLRELRYFLLFCYWLNKQYLERYEVKFDIRCCCCYLDKVRKYCYYWNCLQFYKEGEFFWDIFGLGVLEGCKEVGDYRTRDI